MAPRIWLALSIATLTGCAGLPGGPGGTATPVLGGQVVVAAPRGYCLDPAQRREGPSGAFLLYGTCPGIEGAGPNPIAPAVLTAAVASGAGDLDVGDMDRLAAFLKSPGGKSALSRGSSTTRVELVSLARSDDLIVMQARDADTIDLAEDYWRAVFPQSGALVTVTVSGTASHPLAPATGKALLLDLVKGIRRASPAGPNAAGPRPAKAEHIGDPGETKGLRSLLNRLL